VTLGLVAAAAAPAPRDWRRSALAGKEPTAEILRLDIDGDKKPDILERWWNGKRVRWLDENGDMTMTDTRGDQVADVMQVDMDGDGFYDGPEDQNIKWADNDGDGVADVQAFAINPVANEGNRGAHWMLFIDAEKDGVLGWEDWKTFDFNCWDYTGHGAWLPDYNGDADFLKMHAPPHIIEDHTLNWENPFSFYDLDGDGVSEMAIRWLAPQVRDTSVAKVADVVDDAFISLDLDNDSGKDNETDYDMTLRAFGGPGIPYREFKHPMPALKGNPKFDACFASNNWRRIDSVSYVPREKEWDLFFSAPWKHRWLVFDEDDDDHRWERVEMYYPTHTPTGAPGSVDPYSTKRWTRANNAKEWMAEGEEKPGLGGHPQADSLGDRGEWDDDDSGKGRLYVGVFDRKLHLLGAESGAWTIDRHGRYHGGSRIPSPTGHAPKVEELVKYTDTDGNGYFDTIELDYDADRTIDLKVSLLDYKTAARPHPDEVTPIETAAQGWQGLHDVFTKMSNDAWREALLVYRAAWRRGLTSPEIDRLANAASVAQRYESAYWIKEKVFRLLRARLAEPIAQKKDAVRWSALSEDLKRLYYLGEYDEYVKKIAEVPGR
jgi:hypothetical protein